MIYFKKLNNNLHNQGDKKTLEEALRAQRLVEIFKTLLEEGQITKELICEKFNVSKRTAERDIELLKSVSGLFIEGKRIKDKWYYCLPDDYINKQKFINEHQELITLLLSLALCHFSSTAEKGLKEKFATALKSVFPFQLAEELFYYHDEAPYLEPLRLEELKMLMNAYKDKKLLSLKLRDGKKINFKLFKIIHYVDEFYMAGQESKGGDIVILSLHDLKEIKTLKKTYSIPVDFSIEKHLESAFGIIPGKEEEVVLQVNKEIADYIKQRLWHPSQQIEEQNNGSIILKMHVAINEELIKWILGYGERIKVLKPEGLKNSIKREAEKTLAQYKNDRN